jgi:OPT family oligopeptide transporter
VSTNLAIMAEITSKSEDRLEKSAIDEKHSDTASSTSRKEPTSDEKAIQQAGSAPNESDLEQPPFLFTVKTSNDGAEEAIPEDDPRVKSLPPFVRRVVSLTDDPDLPVFTFRYWVLALLFVIPGAFLSMMSHFRTTAAPYSIFFVQIASSYLGDWWAKTLPDWRVSLPGTKYGFRINPGPFSVKEHVLIVLTAASGATYNLGYTPISMAELYFNETVHPAVAIFFMWGIVWTGYSFAAIARQFLIYDPQYPWFQALCQTALFETQKKQRDQPTAESRKQTRVFWYVLLAVILWQFLPEYAFPMLGSMAFLCWVAPNNATANFVGAGFGGMGFLNFSLDWSNIANLYNLFLTPWWTQVILFAAFVLNCWILLPWAKFGNLGQWHESLMSNRIFLENGTQYPVNTLLTPDIKFNETAYEELGPVYVGTQVLWGMFFDYAAYTSAITWMACFGFSQIKDSMTKLWERRKSGSAKISEQYGDQLNILQRAYPETPFWWFFALFLASFVSLITIVATDSLFIPVYTYFVAVLTGAVMVIPLGYLYALSNFQLVSHPSRLKGNKGHRSR